MSIWGSLLGGIVGFSFGGPIGALIGSMVGGRLSSSRRTAFRQGFAQQQQIFAISLIILTAKLAKVDGHVSKEELIAVKEKLKIPEHEIDQVKKIVALKAQVLYAQAESENNRKRALEEAEKTRKYAIESFCQEIILVKDSLDAALVIENSTLESYKDGVELTVKQLAAIFEKFNIEELDPIGETFDPNFHQAMTMIDSDEEPNKILSVFQKGYKLNGRVLRPALVSVSKEKEKKA